jgi:ABC-type siderophore export system fused ATPase/permease subunit
MQQIREKIAKLRFTKDSIVRELSNLDKAVLEAVEYKKHLDVAQALVQQTAIETQEVIKYSLEDIVNLMLNAMFPDMYTFKLIFEVKGNRTTARIAIIDQGREVSPLKSLGGGVCDCIATSLRVALLLLTTKRRLLILDEVGKHISAGIRPAFYEVMKKLSEDLGIQVLMVTHDETAIKCADKVFNVWKGEDGISRIEAP